MNKITSELLNIKQAAVLLGINPGTIRRWALANTLKGMKVGNRGDWRFKEEDLLKLTNSNDDNRLSPLRPRGEQEAPMIVFIRDTARMKFVGTRKCVL